MAAPTTRFFQELDTSISSNFDMAGGPLENYATQLGTALNGAFIIGMVIWISLMAYEVAFGKSEDGATYLLTKIGKVFLIGVIAFLGFPDLRELLLGLQGIFMGGGNVAQSIDNNIITPYFQMFSEINRVVGDQYAAADFYQFGVMLKLSFLWLFMMAVWIATFIPTAIVAVVGFAMLQISVAMFKVLLALGPAFILCLVFPFTRRFFESWVGGVMTTIFAAGLAAVLMAIASQILNFSGLAEILSPVNTAGKELTEIWGMYFFFMMGKGIASALVVYLFFKSWELASTLGGGVNMGNNMIGGIRSIMRDINKSRAQGGQGAPSQNQITQGRGGSSGGGGSSRPASTFTGAALNAFPRTSAVAANVMTGGLPLMYKGATALGKFAYNRGVKNFLK